MKTKTDPNLTFHGSSIKLYLEDLEEIIKIFSRDGKKVEISDNDYEYQSLDELKQKKKFLKRLTLKRYSPTISLDLGGLYGVFLYADADERLQFYDIREHLINRKSILDFFSLTNTLISFFLFLAMTYFSIEIFKSNPSYNIIFSIYLTLLIFLFLIFLFGLAANMLGLLISVELIYSDEKRSLFTRNKDHLIGMIVGIIATIIGGLALWYIVNEWLIAGK